MKRDKLVTIIFPSRSRLHLVEKLLFSLEDHTYDKNSIEVISICDHDDIDTIKLFQEIAPKLSYDFYFISRTREDKLDLPNQYYSLGLKLASKSYFTWILGNDCEIRVPNWDYNLSTALDASIPDWKSEIEKNEKYYYIKINDDTHWDENNEPRGHARKYGDLSCCFPLLSSNYCEVANEFYPKEIPLWGGDTVLYQILNTSSKLVDINAVELIGIRHYSMHNNRMIQDDVSKTIQSLHIQNRAYVDNNGTTHSVDPWAIPGVFEKMLNDRKHIL